MEESEKRFPVELLASAQYELEEIVRLHLALSGPNSARTITEQFFRAMDRLSQFPLSGPAIRDPELRAAGYRYLIVKNYLMIYRQLGETVLIYHIVHGKTDYPTLFRTNYF